MDGIVLRIKELMTEKAHSVNSFAKAVGIDPANMQKKMKGQQNISGKDVYKICSTLGLRREWLMDGTGPKYETRPTIIQTNDHVHGDAQNIVQSADTAALMAKVELLEKENAWLRSLVEARIKNP